MLKKLIKLDFLHKQKNEADLWWPFCISVKPRKMSPAHLHIMGNVIVKNN